MYLTMQDKEENKPHSIVNMSDALEAGSAMDK